jgi:hypothetical protein
VGPLAGESAVIVGAGQGGDTVACAVAPGAAGVSVEPIHAAGLHGLECAHLVFDATPCVVLGSPKPVMARCACCWRRRASAWGAGGARGAACRAGVRPHRRGRRADSAGAARRRRRPELDAAMLLVQQAALRSPMSLAQASMAKLAATEARSAPWPVPTQIVGAESFREGHILEQLTQDVRALELFAGPNGSAARSGRRRSVAEGMKGSWLMAQGSCLGRA